MNREVTFYYNKNDRPIYEIPSETTIIYFGDNFNQNIRFRISSNIKEIHFGKSFNQSVHKCFGENV